MKQTMSKKIMCLLLATAVFAAVLGIQVKPVQGAELKVYIADEVQGRADHRSMEMGTERDNFYVEFSDKDIEGEDYRLDWTSNNNALVSLRYDFSSKRYVVEAKDEGTAVITAKVTLQDGRVLTDTCIISVYTKRSQTTGVLSDRAVFYRAASTQSVIRRTGDKGQEFTIVASCGDYYRVLLPENYKFEDTLKHQYAYVLKRKVNVPVTEVKLDKKELQVRIGGKAKLGKTVYPEFASDKKVKWSSDKKSVATVDQKGTVRGKKAGTAQITVKTLDGGKRAVCKVKVSKNKKKSAGKGKRIIKGSGISKKYVFRFENSPNNFDLDYGYRLPKKLLDKLVDKVFAQSGYKSKRKLKNRIEEGFDLGWEGVCYGISAAVAMNYCKNINVRKYCKARGEGYDLRYVKKPREDKRVTNLLNYYHISQGYLDEQAIYPDIDKNVWKKLIRAAKQKKLQMCNINPLEEGEGTHNILLKKWIKKKGNWHYIETYDSNHPKAETYIRINMKRKKMKMGYIEKGKKAIETDLEYWCRLIQDFRPFETIKIG